MHTLMWFMGGTSRSHLKKKKNVKPQISKPGLREWGTPTAKAWGRQGDHHLLCQDWPRCWVSIDNPGPSVCLLWVNETIPDEWGWVVTLRETKGLVWHWVSVLPILCPPSAPWAHSYFTTHLGFLCTFRGLKNNKIFWAFSKDLGYLVSCNLCFSKNFEEKKFLNAILGRNDGKCLFLPTHRKQGLGNQKSGHASQPCLKTKQKLN